MVNVLLLPYEWIVDVKTTAVVAQSVVSHEAAVNKI